MADDSSATDSRVRCYQQKKQHFQRGHRCQRGPRPPLPHESERKAPPPPREPTPAPADAEDFMEGVSVVSEDAEPGPSGSSAGRPSEPPRMHAPAPRNNPRLQPTIGRRCPYCNLFVGAAGSLGLHIKVQHPYRCGLCRVVFPSGDPALLREHRAQHKRCADCLQTFMGYRELQQHYACHICASCPEFVGRGSVAENARHMFEFHNIGVQCPCCGHISCDAQSADMHGVMHDHCREGRHRIVCRPCDKVFSTLKLLKRHFEMSSQHRKMGILCETCQIIFATQQQHTEHHRPWSNLFSPPKAMTNPVCLEARHTPSLNARRCGPPGRGPGPPRGEQNGWGDGPPRYTPAVVTKIVMACPLCLSDNVQEATSTPCGHVFCTECIKQGLQMSNACPVCRQPCLLQDLRRLYLDH